MIRDPGSKTIRISPCVKRAEARSAEEVVLVEKQPKAFENEVPGTHVVRLPGAHHYVFLSNEADVLREIHAFVASLR